MLPKSHRETVFPSSNQVAHREAGEKKANINRRTRFPGKTGLLELSIRAAGEPLFNVKPGEKEAPQLPQPLPLKVNPPDTTPSKPYPDMDIQTSQRDEPPNVRVKSPWSTYKALRTLERGGEVTAACTQEEPIKMVAVKKLSSNHFKRHAMYQHENLLLFIEAYQYEGVLFAITDYTAATLKQVITIPLPLKEVHISTTYRQESSSILPTIHLTKYLQGF
jgi:hypothetical protein